ncbi:MAG: FAD:protein FMN transferase [Candidatus Omnitrophica bacterium]|nr:FAD:protein FMN transferase [Candidatus Omnitrophota bacterium]
MNYPIAKTNTRRLLGPILLAALCVITVISFFKTGPSQNLIPYTQDLADVMSTECRLVAIMPASTTRAQVDIVLGRAEARLRETEVRMSSYIDYSELARWNASGPGQYPLSSSTLQVLNAAQHYYRLTGGCFDVTCRPLIQLWRQADRENSLPSPGRLQEARVQSGWSAISLTEDAAIKLLSTVQLDLGGIAKGYGIDRAVEELESAGCRGGMVDVGGDLRCFGQGPDGGAWQIGIRHPAEPGKVLARLSIQEGAVCTSGDYARFFEIQGRRYSHIIDPRTGMPAHNAVSVTVLAPTALAADAWATALSVAGIPGLDALPRNMGIEAMVVSGEGGEPEIRMTKGFKARLIKGPKL